MKREYVISACVFFFCCCFLFLRSTEANLGKRLLAGEGMVVPPYQPVPLVFWETGFSLLFQSRNSTPVRGGPHPIRPLKEVSFLWSPQQASASPVFRPRRSPFARASLPARVNGRRSGRRAPPGPCPPAVRTLHLCEGAAAPPGGPRGKCLLTHLACVPGLFSVPPMTWFSVFPCSYLEMEEGKAFLRSRFSSCFPLSAVSKK